MYTWVWVCWDRSIDRLIEVPTYRRRKEEVEEAGAVAPAAATWLPLWLPPPLASRRRKSAAEPCAVLRMACRCRACACVPWLWSPYGGFGQPDV